MYKIAILDDDSLQLERTKVFLTEYLKKKNILFELTLFMNSQELLEQMHAYKLFDVIFLDIELGEELGIDIAKQINVIDKNTQIIFLTNYIHYATDIFETQHCYYVLKEELGKRLESIFEKLQMSERDEVLKIKLQSNHFIVNQKEIIYIERELRASIVHCEQDEFRTNDKLSDLISRLNPDHFIRCHTSYIVNLNHIRQYKRQEIIMDNDMSIPISRTYYKEVQRRLMKWAQSKL